MKPGVLFVALVVAGASIAGILWLTGSISPVEVVNSVKGADPEGLPISDTGPWPKVVLPATEFDFGAMAAGTKKSHKFTIKNEGDAPLRLKIKGTDCSCTLGTLAKDEIPVGGEAEAELTWEPPADDPEFRKQAEIWTNDPNSPIVTLRISGRVERVLQMEPANGWTVQNLQRTEPETLTAHVTSAILDKFSITSIETSSDSLKATYEPMTAEELKNFDFKCGYNITVTLDAKNFKVGTIEENIEIHTDVDGAETIAFPVTGQYLGSITGLPWRPDGVKTPLGMTWSLEHLQINLGDVPVGEGGTGWYKLLVGDVPEGQKFEVTSIEPSSEFVEATIAPLPKSPTNPREVFVVTFKVKPGVAPGSYLGKQSVKVIFKTNHPYAPEIKFYVSFNAT